MGNSIGGTAPQFSFPVQSSGEVKQASKLPLFASILFFSIGALSIGLAFWLESRNFFILGYFFTPVANFLCVAWDALAQRKGSRDPWFAVNRKLSLVVRLLAMASIFPALVHIWNIATWLGELSIQNGWFS